MKTATITITLTRTIEVPIYDGEYEVINHGYEYDRSESDGKGEHWEDLVVTIEPKTALNRVIVIPEGYEIEDIYYN